MLRRQGYGRQVDLWSLGVISFILLCGYPPFYSENNQDLFQQIMKGAYEFESPHWDDISKEAKDFIAKLLVVDPKKRFSAKQALAHKFIIDNCAPPPLPAPRPKKAKEVVTPMAAETAIVSAAPAEQANVDHQPHPTKNLAQRVSMNLRNRGASITSRRKSVDIKPTRALNQPHAPPPVPGSRHGSVKPADVPSVSNSAPKNDAIREDEEAEHPLKPKDQQTEISDSGVVSSNKASQDEKLNKPADVPEEDSTDNLLRQLSVMNRMLECGKLEDAEMQLDKLDCPHQIRQLYMDIIKTGARDRSAVIEEPKDEMAGPTNTPDKVPTTQEFIADLSKIVAKTKPSMYRLNHQQTTATIQSARLENAPTEDDSLTGLPAPANSKGSKGSNEFLHANNFIHNFLGGNIFAKKNAYGRLKDEEQRGGGATFESEQVRVLSYNLMLRPPGIKNNHSDYKNARLAYFCEHILPNYDVVALQEVFSFGTRRRDRLLQRATELGFKSWVCSPSAPGDTSAAFDGGLLILSRFNIARSARLIFSDAAQADKMFAKGVLYAKISLGPNRGYLHLFNTHLQSSYDAIAYTLHNPADVTIQARAKQLRSLKSFMSECLANNMQAEVDGTRIANKIVLLGGFNVNGRVEPRTGVQHSEEYVEMKRALEKPTQEGDGAVVWKLADLLYSVYHEHPVTFGAVNDYVSKVPTESVLTNKKLNGICASLDYAFEIKPNPEEVDQFSEERIEIDVFSIKVEKFFTKPGSADILASMEAGVPVTPLQENAPLPPAPTATLPECKETLYSQTELEPVPLEASKSPVSMSTVSCASNASDDGYHTPLESTKQEKSAMQKALDSLREALEGLMKTDKAPGQATSVESVATTNATLAPADAKKTEQKVGKVMGFWNKAGAESKPIKFTQVSDHYGVSFTVRINKRDD